tara:strand:- start:264 stop:635 length:372 start_codon:yes stop_codon:yes gene_type:complete
MKKLFLVALVFFGLETQAQVGTDLQFSQIVTLQGSVWGNIMLQELVGQVPAGKIWKTIGCGVGLSGHSNSFFNSSNCDGLSFPILLEEFNNLSGLYPPALSKTGIGAAGIYLNENTQVYTSVP